MDTRKIGVREGGTRENLSNSPEMLKRIDREAKNREESNLNENGSTGKQRKERNSAPSDPS
uniref:Uncharacterized protein n=1 Tax=Zea mays TaxID=4577 RepID=B8A1M3_MAIZE|nr:unknown [Zea mays]